MLNGNQGCSEYYYYYKTNAKTGKAGPKNKEIDAEGAAGIWFVRHYDWTTGSYDKENEVKAVKRIKSGESFQWSCARNNTITFSGAVPVTGVTVDSDENNGFVYTGNPFAADVDIQSIIPSAQCNIQFLNENQGCSEYYYYYKTNAKTGKAGPKNKEIDAEGAAGIWFVRHYDWTTGSYDKENEVKAVRTIKAGEGFQWSCARNNTLTIQCPYSL